MMTRPEEYDWITLRNLQKELIAAGYAFHVTPQEHRVSLNDQLLFGSSKLTRSNPDDARYRHWSLALHSANAHRLYAQPKTKIHFVQPPEL